MERELRENTPSLLSYYYTLIFPVYRHRIERPRYPNHDWLIIEKGYPSPQREFFWHQYISYEKIRSALFEIREWCIRTPLRMSSLLQNKGFNIYLKSAYCNENDPNLNSIKTRGVIYSLQQLTAEQKSKGVIAISTGSFAYPLCSFGRRFGIPVTVVMPQDAAEERKVRMCRDLGARVIIKGRNITEAHVSALRTAQAEGLFYLDGNDHPYMIVGQATFGIELDEIRDEKGQMKKFPLDAVILPTNINGCNLTMGLALAIKQWHPNIKIIEICSEQNNSLIQDVRKQTLSTTELKDSPRTFWGHKNIDCLPNCWINLFSTVSEKFVQKAADLLLEKENIIDSYAAIGLAAILNGQLDDLKGKNVLIPLFGRMDSFMDLTNKPGSSREVN